MHELATRITLEEFSSPVYSFGYKVSFFRNSEIIRDAVYAARVIDNHLALESMATTHYKTVGQDTIRALKGQPALLGIEDNTEKGRENAKFRLYNKAECILSGKRNDVATENRVSNIPRVS